MGRRGHLRVVQEGSARLAEVLDEDRLSERGQADVSWLDMRVFDLEADGGIAPDLERSFERRKPSRARPLDDLELEPFRNHAPRIRSCPGSIRQTVTASNIGAQTSPSTRATTAALASVLILSTRRLVAT
jgi:hypothetical protein